MFNIFIYYSLRATDPIAFIPKFIYKKTGIIIISVYNFITYCVSALDEAIAMWYWKLREMVIRSWIGRLWLFIWRLFKKYWAPINYYITLRRAQTAVVLIEIVRPCTIIPEYSKDNYGWFVLVLQISVQYLFFKSSAYDIKHKGKKIFNFLIFCKKHNFKLSPEFEEKYKSFCLKYDFYLMWFTQISLMISHSFR